MKISEWLLLCAYFHDKGRGISPEVRRQAPEGWHSYLTLTLPEPFAPAYSDGSLDSTRPMRFMLAASIAKSEGQ